MANTEALTVGKLSKRWGVTTAKIRSWIDQGELIARNISPGGKRATWRIDPDDATAFWDSLSTRTMRHQRKTKPIKVNVGGLEFEDFIR